MPAASGATLAVKILADISDLQKNLPQAERAFLRSVDNLTSIGKRLTVGVTAPFLALSAVLAKSAAEDQASIAKLQRTFGTGAQAMETWISQLMKTVPATDDEIRGLAVSTDTLLRSMGMSAPAAQRMTQSVTKLAGDLAAYNHVELGVAQDALEHALEGKTKGLAQFGIAISETDVKARAYQLGIAKLGQELTHTQTAQATWSLILEKSTMQQGEAARTIDDGANALKRLRQATDNAADSMGTVFLPIAARVVGTVANLLNTIASLPDGAKNTIGIVGGIAAAAGPAIFIVGSLTEKLVLLKNVLTDVGKVPLGTGILKWLVAGGVAAALIGGPVVAIIHAFDKQGEAARRTSDDLEKYTQSLDKLTLAQLKQQSAASGGLLKTLEAQRAGVAAKINGLPKAGTPGYDVNTTPADRNQLSTQLSAIAEQERVVQAEFDAITAKIKAMNATAAGGGETKGLPDLLKDVEQRAQTVTQAIEEMKKGWAPIPGVGAAWASALRDAERILEAMPDKLDPIAVKAREIVQSLRAIIDPNAFVSGFGATITKASAGNALDNVKLPTAAQLPVSPVMTAAAARLAEIKDAMNEGFANVANSIGVTLADTLGNKLITFLGARGIGNGLGGQLGGGLGGAFGGGFGASLGGDLSKSIGGLLGAGVGSIIPVAGTLIGGVLGSALGGLFGSHKHAVDQNTQALGSLTTATNAVAEALSNAPMGFKIDPDRYLAQDARTSPGSSPTPGGPPLGTGRGDLVVYGDMHVTVVGVSDTKSLVQETRASAQASTNRGGVGLKLAMAGF